MKKVIILSALVGAVGGGVYYISLKPGLISNLMHGQPAAPPPQAPAAAPPPPSAPRAAAQAAKLPDLEQSDDFVRERAKSLSGNPKLPQWLKNENLIRRITAAMAIVADGNGPRDSLSFLKPRAPFSVMSRKGRIYINPKSYNRYDAISDAFQSLDTEKTAMLWKDLRPLFQKAYEELGYSKGSVQEVLIRAISVLLDAPVVVGNIPLRRKVISYAIADDRLEKMSPAQKHLLRMGPENAAKIQNKLREIALAIGAAQDQLPKSQTYNPEAK